MNRAFGDASGMTQVLDEPWVPIFLALPICG